MNFESLRSTATFTSASDEDVTEFERAVDRSFSATPLPTQHVNTAVWATLAIAEDRSRILSTVQTLRSPFNQVLESVGYANSVKFTLKQALAAVIGRTRSSRSKTNPEIDEKLYGKTSVFLDSARDYALASAAFTLLHQKRAKAEIGGESRKLIVSVSESSHVIDAIDIYNTRMRPGDDLLGLLSKWFLFRDGRPSRILDAIRSGSAFANGVMNYVFDLSLAHEVNELVPIVPDFLPPNFNLSWGTSADLRSLLRAFQAVCLYHVLVNALDVEASRKIDRQISSLVMTRHRNTWIKNLANVARVSTESAALFVDALTYGTSTRSPDPALQPLIQTEPGLLSVAPYCLVLSANPERNLLSLATRVIPKEVNSLSQQFSARMTDEVALKVRQAGWICETEKNIVGAREAGDLDVLIVDAINGVILACELRWMIPAADPNEIINRSKESQAKLAKVRRRTEALKRDPNSTLRACGIDVEARDWTVLGIVVLDGFSDLSSDPIVPIVPLSQFVSHIRRFRGLREVHDRLRESWHPKIDSDFQVVSTVVTFDQHMLEWYAIQPAREGMQRWAKQIEI